MLSISNNRHIKEHNSLPPYCCIWISYIDVGNYSTTYRDSKDKIPISFDICGCVIGTDFSSKILDIYIKSNQIKTKRNEIYIICSTEFLKTVVWGTVLGIMQAVVHTYLGAFFLSLGKGRSVQDSILDNCEGVLEYTICERTCWISGLSTFVLTRAGPLRLLGKLS